jgi:hypothetical protein
MAMKAKLEPENILKQIAGIRWMERGKLCPLRSGAYYNHQTWEKGRNVVRYVPREQVAELQKAIACYQEYQKLTTAYADEIIRRTRQTQTAKSSHRTTKKRKIPDKPEI